MDQKNAAKTAVADTTEKPGENSGPTAGRGAAGGSGMTGGAGATGTGAGTGTGVPIPAEAGSEKE